MASPAAGELWGTAMGATTQGGQGMVETMQGWLYNPWFYIVICLTILALILFIWAVTVQVKFNKTQVELSLKKEELNGTTMAGYRRRQKSKYMPDPGHPEKRLPFEEVTQGDQSGYVAGMGQDPDAVLKSALYQ